MMLFTNLAGTRLRGKPAAASRPSDARLAPNTKTERYMCYMIFNKSYIFYEAGCNSSCFSINYFIWKEDLKSVARSITLERRIEGVTSIQCYNERGKVSSSARLRAAAASMGAEGRKVDWKWNSGFVVLGKRRLRVPPPPLRDHWFEGGYQCVDAFILEWTLALALHVASMVDSQPVDYCSVINVI